MIIAIHVYIHVRTCTYIPQLKMLLQRYAIFGEQEVAITSITNRYMRIIHSTCIITVYNWYNCWGNMCQLVYWCWTGKWF